MQWLAITVRWLNRMFNLQTLANEEKLTLCCNGRIKVVPTRDSAYCLRCSDRWSAFPGRRRPCFARFLSNTEGCTWGELPGKRAARSDRRRRGRVSAARLWRTTARRSSWGWVRLRTSGLRQPHMSILRVWKTKRANAAGWAENGTRTGFCLRRAFRSLLAKHNKSLLRVSSRGKAVLAAMHCSSKARFTIDFQYRVVFFAALKKSLSVSETQQNVMNTTKLCCNNARNEPQRNRQWRASGGSSCAGTLVWLKFTLTTNVACCIAAVINRGRMPIQGGVSKFPGRHEPTRAQQNGKYGNKFTNKCISFCNTLYGKESFPSKESDTKILQIIYIVY